jgi:hypothetical protein
VNAGDPFDGEPLQILFEEKTTVPFWSDVAFKWSGCAAFLAGAAAAVKYPVRLERTAPVHDSRPDLRR